MSNDPNRPFQIQVRRHPLLALGILAVGGALTATGFLMETYAFAFVGGACLVLGALAYMNPALTITANTIELRNLFGFVGRTIPHDGLEKLTALDGQLLIEYDGQRAALPKPRQKGLHQADWQFMVDAFEKARSLKS